MDTERVNTEVETEIVNMEMQNERVKALQDMLDKIDNVKILVPKNFKHEDVNFSDADVAQLIQKIAATQEPDADEVYPHLYVGNGKSVKTMSYLKDLGITHVLNAAEGDWVASVSVDQEEYKEHGVEYWGMKCNDLETVDISVYFQDTANFIDLALSGGGKVLVNCFAGVSRSATIAVSYLIQKKGMTVEEALVTVKTNRDVHPNKGFLSKLIQLEEQLKHNKPN